MIIQDDKNPDSYSIGLLVSVSVLIAFMTGHDRLGYRYFTLQIAVYHITWFSSVCSLLILRQQNKIARITNPSPGALF